MSRTDVRVGIIGPGQIAGFHADALQRLGAPVTAVAGPNSNETIRFAELHGIPHTYDSAEELVADAPVDAVIIASPNHVHSAQTLSALRAGKHVLCEVPMAMSAGEADRVVEAAEGSGLVATVAHTLRYWPTHTELSDRLREAGERPTHVVIRSMTRRHTNVGWTGRARDWTDNVLWHGGAHLVDTSLWLLGSSSVSVQGACGADWPSTGLPMDVSTVLQTEDRRLANLSLSYHSLFEVNDLLVITEENSFSIAGGRLSGPQGVLADVGDSRDTHLRAVEAQDGEFIDAIVGGRLPKYTLADALPTMRVLQEIDDRRSP